jgi:major membrane immunogen (membrane-anchored lipoprotein)
MKKTCLFALLLLLTSLMGSSCRESGKNDVTGVNDGNGNTGKYLNGAYEGKTPIDYEGYNALADIRVTNGLISIVDWKIYDNNSKRYFDETYEEGYTGIPVYIQQCRDNMKGMKAYGPNLIRTQSIDSVETITGATWCYHKFQEVVKITLKNAKKDSTNK